MYRAGRPTHTRNDLYDTVMVGRTGARAAQDRAVGGHAGRGRCHYGEHRHGFADHPKYQRKSTHDGNDWWHRHFGVGRQKSHCRNWSFPFATPRVPSSGDQKYVGAPAILVRKEFSSSALPLFPSVASPRRRPSPFRSGQALPYAGSARPRLYIELVERDRRAASVSSRCCRKSRQSAQPRDAGGCQ